MTKLEQLLETSAAFHRHLCPRQVLGVRMGLLAGSLLDLEVPNRDKQLLTIAETDGCAADGLSAGTGCSVGNRLMRVLDFGKVAATFVHLRSGGAYRIAPRDGIRAAARREVPHARSRWHAQLQAYQLLPDLDLFAVQEVQLSISLEKLLSKPGYRVNCDLCGEEVINEREVIVGSSILCRACAGQGYYHAPGQEISEFLWLDLVEESYEG